LERGYEAPERGTHIVYVIEFLARVKISGAFSVGWAGKQM